MPSEQRKIMLLKYKKKCARFKFVMYSSLQSTPLIGDLTYAIGGRRNHPITGVVYHIASLYHHVRYKVLYITVLRSRKVQ